MPNYSNSITVGEDSKADIGLLQYKNRMKWRFAALHHLK
jgi:hypothetical protein